MEEMPGDELGDAPEGVWVRNPYSELVPGGIVGKIVTEWGVLGPGGCIGPPHGWRSTPAS